MADDPYAGLGVAAPASAPAVDPYEGLGVAAPDRAPKPVSASMSVNNPPMAAPSPNSEPPQANMLERGTRYALGGIGEVARFYRDAFANAPADAANVAGATYSAFRHPVDTANSLGKLVRGLEPPMQMVKVTMPNGTTEYQPQPVPETPEAKATRIAPAQAFGDEKVEQYGSLPKIINSLRNRPISTAMDASTLFGGAGGVLARAPGTLGKVGEVAQQVGRAVDPLTTVGNTAKVIGNAGESVVSNTLGQMTGATKRDVRAAGRAGMEPGGNEAFWGQYTGRADKTAPVDLAQSGMSQKIAEKNAEYRSGMHDIRQDTTVLAPRDWARIDSAVETSNEMGKYKGAIVKGKATAVNNEIKALVNDWKTLNPDSPIFAEIPKAQRAAVLTPENFHTPEGLDALKRAIGDIRDSTLPNTTERVAANQTYNAVKKEINDINPVYAKVMGNYREKAGELRDIRKTLSLGEKASTDTALGKLQSTSRETAQTRGRVQMVDELAKHEPDLPYALAGQNLNALAPRGLVAKLGLGTGASTAATVAALVHNHALAAAIVPLAIASSPKIVGGAAYGAGRVAGMTGRGANALHLNADTIRALERAGYQGANINALTRE